MSSKITQSQTKEIRRSQIRLNPFNPKRHPEEAVKLQQRNFKKVGFLGGISWNEATGHLLDGHRRVLAMDAINKYDGTEATDYLIKVEATHLDEKTEKEQMTYMAVGNTKADMDLIAEYIGDIDTKDIGLTDVEISSLLKFSQTESAAPEDTPAVETFFDFVPTPTVQTPEQMAMTPEQKKEHVKNVRMEQNQDIDEYSSTQNMYITLSFSSEEAKVAFCEMVGADGNEKFIKGEDILEMMH